MSSTRAADRKQRKRKIESKEGTDIISRKRKSLFAFLTAAAVLLALTGCSKSSGVTIGSYGSHSSKRAYLTYEEFSGVKEYRLKTDSDSQNIKVCIETVSGSLNVSIETKDGEKSDPVYTGTDVASSSFTVTVPEAGTYIVRLEAKHHKGSYSFEVC